MELKRYPEAEAASREAIRLDRTLAPAYANLGIVLKGLTQYREAEAASRKAARLNRAQAPPRGNLSYVLRAMKRRKGQ